MSYPPEPPPPGPGYGAGYGPGQPPYGPMVAPTSGKATASLVIGVASLVLSWCCGLGISGIVAIVLGVKARREIAASGGRLKGDGIALSGIVTGAIAVVLGVLILGLIVVAVLAGAEIDVDTGTQGTQF